MKVFRIFTNILLLLFVEPALAQSKFSVGAVMQPQVSVVNGDYYIYSGNVTDKYPSLDKKTSIKYSLGIESAFNFSRSFSLNLSVMYSRQGQDFGSKLMAPYVTMNGAEFSFSTSVDYLKIPLSLECRLNPDKKITVVLYTGMYYGYMVKYSITHGRIDYNDPPTDPSEFTSTYTTTKYVTELNSNVPHYDEIYYPLTDEAYVRTDIGMQIGSGVEIKISDKIKIPIFINWDFGFTDIKNYNSIIINYIYGYDNKFWQIYSDKNLSEGFSNSTLGIKTGVRISV
jgi:hypothetical protein